MICDVEWKKLKSNQIMWINKIDLQEVIERTRELVEEKKKSDLLLYRMLPR